MRESQAAEITICGAGIAGIAAAYFLSEGFPPEEILLIDERPPLSLTSDKSTEAYRNWWPGPDGAMIALMNRSIDLMEQLARRSGDRFQLNRRGYLFVSADQERIAQLTSAAKRAAHLGAGPLRIHRGRTDEPAYIPAATEGYLNQPTGSDLILEPSMIRAHFPYLTERARAVLHARRCGWFSGQQMGMVLLEYALQRGVRFLQASVQGVGIKKGQLSSVHVRTNGSTISLSSRVFINAAGPMLRKVSSMLALDLPVYCERHLKVSMRDNLGFLPRQAPLLILHDPQQLDWNEEERSLLSHAEEDQELLSPLPPGVHARPEGGSASSNILILWAYDLKRLDPIFPVSIPASFAEVALRGLTAMIPAMKTYLKCMPKPVVDGGYYTRTVENRFLCGPLPIQGAYLIGALSGYGLMAACGAGELLAAHVLGHDLPAYASAFSLERYDDPTYRKKWEYWDASDQL